MATSNTARDEWVDISLAIRDGMVHWPGDPPVRIERVQDLERGDAHSLSNLTLGSHAGTHVDAPAHFLKGAAAIDKMPAGLMLGRYLIS